MFVGLYNDIIFLMRIIVFIIIAVVAIIFMPYIIKFITSMIYKLIKIFGYAKSYIKPKDIKFDEFSDIDEFNLKEEKTNREMQHEYEVLEQVYNESFDRSYDETDNSLDIMDIIEAQKNVEKAKKDLYNFKMLDSVQVKDQISSEGAHLANIKKNQQNFEIELFKKWSKEIFKCIKLGKEEDLKIVEKVMTHEMYNKLLQQIRRFKKDGLEFITEDLIIKETRIIDYSKINSKEEVRVLIKAKMKEYILKKDTQQVIRGSYKKSYEKKIVMTFLKNNVKEEEGFITNCPNCGAETAEVEFGKCRYCDTIIFPIRYNWTLIKFETI